ncbi:hypothetical protein QA600_08470 [Natronococcus sp. A-GB1]|uniref:hypothetical protein n=1 Tax=Natronococcus sp. A-GB1 TaxID=3037648 RepID=UPI00241FF228|nr:hypothetical protein [Natronococcus sp. A-GB1]MDG5759375.1 hypothetical protein [Natronococcus sp. A-GB1]
MDTGTDGEPTALEAATGKRQWKVDISDSFQPDENDFNDAVRGNAVARIDPVFSGVR